jgi:hypothetical protein
MKRFRFPRIPKHLLLLALLACRAPAGGADDVAATLSLAGTWRFRLDPKDDGVSGKWFSGTLQGRIQLPGSLQAQGFGDEVSVSTPWTGSITDRSWFTAPEYAKYRKEGNIKIPFWLQPEKYYVGAAWYQKEVEIPAGWRGKRITLTLERPHWETRLWLDERFVGSGESLSAPHLLDLGTDVSPGKHTITLRVDNRLLVNVGRDAHSVTDHTQGNWNGVVGRLLLSAGPPVWLKDIQVVPRVAAKSALVKGSIGNSTGKAGSGKVRLVARLIAAAGESPSPGSANPRAETLEVVLPVSWDARGGSFAADFALGDSARLWDEFHPNLYRLTATLDPQGDSKDVTFGLREISTRGTQFLINGRKTFIRGTLECCIFPLTGHPPTDKASWKRVMEIARGHGLNQLRFHSWCPPEAAFEAADELGFYLYAEGPAWGDVDDPGLARFIHEEGDRILQAYGNHPSFCLLSYGNEPGGRNQAQFFDGLLKSWKGKDSRRLYTSAAGWPQVPENQFHITPDPRIQAWGGGLKTRINARPPETRTDYRDYIAGRAVPVISHEIGQWCVYPNLDEIPKYTGHLKARNFEIFRETLEAKGMGDQARAFLLASGKLQTLCYKEDIESALRTPGMGGFHLLDLHDFPGQGTALVGVLDPFWDSKGYVTAAEYHRFCGSTVPLARFEKRVFTTEETLQADIEVAHFGPAPLPGTAASWKLVAEGDGDIAEGKLEPRDIPVDNGTRMGSIQCALSSAPAPRKCKLVVRLEGTSAENDWDIWVYPARLEAGKHEDLLIVEELGGDAVTALQSGGKVLWLLPPERVRDPSRRKVALGFSSIFWNTAWTGGQAPHTLGILCDPKHPALAAFPTEFHSNWQWWYLISRARAMVLDGLPGDFRPIVQVIDDWVTNRKLGLVLEARVLRGKLLVSSMDLKTSASQDPVSRQMLHSLIEYAAGERFQPRSELTLAEAGALSAPPSAMERLGARVAKVDSAEPGFEGEKAIDGDSSTMWHTAYSAGKPDFPHEIQIELRRPAPIRGFTVLPRQDGNKNGWIKEYALYSSEDGKEWGEPAAKGAFADDPGLKTVLLDKPRAARFLRLVALSGHAPGPWASLAELEILPGGK